MRLAITGGLVVDPSQKLSGSYTVLIEDGQIAGLVKDHKFPKGKGLTDYEIMDVKGATLCPGFIDLHTHLREPGFEYREDIASGTRAAAAGGFTTICCMANTNPVNDNGQVTEFILKQAKAKGLVHVLPVGAVSQGLKGKGLAAIGEMVSAGVVAVSDDGEPVMNGALMRHAMEYTKGFGIPVISHAEDKDLSQGGLMHEGEVSVRLGLKGIPAAAEETMIHRDILLARLTGCHLHVAHLSSRGGVDLVRQAKKMGIPVTCEVTPHHLLLTDEACAGFNPHAKVKPPLRSEVDRNSLLQGLCDGTIDAIATDHAPHSLDEKMTAFDEANFGMVGLETALPLLLKLVESRKLKLGEMVRLLTSGPATVLNLKKGSLKKGWPADLCIFDPKSPVTIDSSKFHSKGRNTPFEGFRLNGKILYTIVEGRKIFPFSTLNR